MIQLENASVMRGGRTLFEKASMQLHPQWKIGLTGANGAGKSTLFSALLGNLGTEEGSINRPQAWTIAHMAQEVEALSLPAIDFVLAGDEEYWQIKQQLDHSDQLDIEQISPLFSRFEEIGGYVADAKASQLMAGLGFKNNQLQNDVASFSGGWRMRLNLARTLMSRSDLLLLDEPTNHLDLDAVLWLEDWLKQYEGTLLLISHDRDFLDAVTDHILHIEQQKLNLYSGNYSQFEQVRAERLAQQQQAYEKQQQTREHLQKFIDRFKAKASKAKQAQSRVKQLERMQQISSAHVDQPFTFQFRQPTKMSTPLLTLDQADIGYSDKIIIKNVNISLDPDSRLGLLGMNGAGKSTLIKALVADLAIVHGERNAAENLNLGYFAQHQMDALDDAASPMLQLARIAGSKISEAALRAFLGGFGFQGERIDTACKNFSGGERARLALALIVWQRPNVLVLDEPTNHLDLDMRLALTMALQNFEGAVVLVSHERQLMNAICDQFMLVHNGECKLFEGDLDDYVSWLRKAKQAEMKQQLTTKPTVEAKEVKSKAAVAPVALPEEENPKLDKDAQRKLAAQQREATRPIRREIERLEKKLVEYNDALNCLEQKLADETIYLAENKADLLLIMEQQTVLKQQQQQTEEKLLESMMELEQFQTD